MYRQIQTKFGENPIQANLIYPELIVEQKSSKEVNNIVGVDVEHTERSVMFSGL